MNLTRPKSSKGRSRPTLSNSTPGEATNLHDTLMTPKPPSMEYKRSDGFIRSQSHSLFRPHRFLNTDASEIMQEAPPFPSHTFSKYTVLPSIEKRQSVDGSGLGMDDKTSKVNVSDNMLLQSRACQKEEPCISSVRARAATRSNPEIGNVAEVHCRAYPNPPDPSTRTSIQPQTPSLIPPGSVLLAVRGPCGRRFQQHFLPSDSLLAVIVSAESRLGTSYEHGFIETMDVPRRTFTNLKLTLRQCGIVNRSVLCISLEDSAVDSA
ncbi:UBX domain-containing protein 10 [Aplochiton taeniatus]